MTQHEQGQAIASADAAVESQAAPALASAGAGRPVRLCFGRRWVSPELLARLQTGSVLELDSEVASPVEVYADGRLAGFGSAVVVGGMVCIRLDRKAAPTGAETK